VAMPAQAGRVSHGVVIVFTVPLFHALHLAAHSARDTRNRR
jgi:hypothetical protein